MRKLADYVTQTSPRILSTAGLKIEEEHGLGFLKLNTRALTSKMAEAVQNGSETKLPDAFGVSIDFQDYHVIRTAPIHWQILGQDMAVEALRKRLLPTIDGRSALATSLANGRTAFRISGTKAAELLSSMIAIDFHSQYFKTGQVAITRMEETGALVQCLKAGEDYRAVVDQSYSDYVWRLFEYNSEGLSSS